MCIRHHFSTRTLQGPWGQVWPTTGPNPKLQNNFVFPNISPTQYKVWGYEPNHAPTSVVCTVTKRGLDGPARLRNGGLDGPARLRNASDKETKF